MWMAKLMNLPEIFNVQFGTVSFPIVWSIAGSAIFVAILSLATRRRI